MDKLTADEQKIIVGLSTPIKIQDFISTLSYNYGKRIAAIDVLRLKKADCLEAASFAQILCKKHGIQAWIMDLTCIEKDEEDHVICVFKEKGLFGAIAQSKFLGLRYRNPVYVSLRELAMSYFENYFNYDGGYDLGSRSIPIKFKEEWLFSVDAMIKTEDKLNEIKHISLVPKKVRLNIVTPEKFHAELSKIPKGVKVHERYK